MGKIGVGYGSEWHLLRYLGWHRDLLNRQVLHETGGSTVGWIDQKFRPRHSDGRDDNELQGLEFLPTSAPAREAWPQWWAPHGGSQSWDAVGQLSFGETGEWLLVEAKAHVSEMDGPGCGAKSTEEKGRRAAIEKALDETKRAVAVPLSHDWLGKHYQYANRLAALHFLTKHGIPARLLFIYFTGDQCSDGRDCPATSAAWQSSIARKKAALGLTGSSSLESRVHELFLPVREDSASD